MDSKRCNEKFVGNFVAQNRAGKPLLQRTGHTYRRIAIRNPAAQLAWLTESDGAAAHQRDSSAAGITASQSAKWTSGKKSRLFLVAGRPTRRAYRSCSSVASGISERSAGYLAWALLFTRLSDALMMRMVSFHFQPSNPTLAEERRPHRCRRKATWDLCAARGGNDKLAAVHCIGDRVVLAEKGSAVSQSSSPVDLSNARNSLSKSVAPMNNARRRSRWDRRSFPMPVFVWPLAASSGYSPSGIFHIFAGVQIDGVQRTPRWSNGGISFRVRICVWVKRYFMATGGGSGSLRVLYSRRSSSSRPDKYFDLPSDLESPAFFPSVLHSRYQFVPESSRSPTPINEGIAGRTRHFLRGRRCTGSCRWLVRYSRPCSARERLSKPSRSN